MNRLLYPFIWLSRVHRCQGFGIQSPSDFSFVREVINEHSPYYAYAEIGKGDRWLQRKRGFLYFRLANWRQPQQVIDRVEAAEYVKAGCRRANILPECDGHVELALLKNVEEAIQLLPFCDDRSVIVVEEIKGEDSQWDRLFSHQKVVISYDLYYCGILLFDSKRAKQHYVVNF